MAEKRNNLVTEPLKGEFVCARRFGHRVRWLALNAADEERKTFEAGFDSMQKGGSETFEQLGEYLAKAG
jgi:hypothetical protein